MTTYVLTDASGRLTACAAPGFHCGEGEIAVTLPEDFDPAQLTDWVLEAGLPVYSPLPAAPASTPLGQRVEEIECALMELAALIGGDAA